MSGERFRLFSLAIPGTPQPFLIPGQVSGSARNSARVRRAIPVVQPSRSQYATVFFNSRVGTERRDARPSSSRNWRFPQGKDPDCPAIILYRYADCETSGLSRTDEHEVAADLTDSAD